MKSYSNVLGMGSGFANKSAQHRRIEPFRICPAHNNIGCECKRKKHHLAITPNDVLAAAKYVTTEAADTEIDEA